MLERKTEQIIYYFLGAIIGMAVGFIVLSFKIEISKESEKALFLFVMVLTGVFVSVILSQRKTLHLFNTGRKVRDEAVTLITHEMRTGLTYTEWSIEMILNEYGDKLSEEDKRTLHNAIKTTKTTIMHSINLLDISLLDADKLSISLEKTTMGEIEIMLNELIEKYTLGAKRKNVDLIHDINIDKEKKAEVDMMRLRIIIENLLENSLQYTTERDEITVTLKNDDKDMTISVGDNGIGIPEDEQSKVFLQFYRAKNARAKLGSGSGIGLYMCQKYVKAHKGTISFVSKENAGTTFYIKIPLTTSEDLNKFLKEI